MNDFHALSDQTLEEISDFFESSWPNADVDLIDGTLTISVPKGQYVINKHGVTHQIWVASPFSGAHHFHYKDKTWVCTRKAITLQDFLSAELNTYAS